MHTHTNTHSSPPHTSTHKPTQKEHSKVAYTNARPHTQTQAFKQAHTHTHTHIPFKYYLQPQLTSLILYFSIAISTQNAQQQNLKSYESFFPF
jgi:hypothetical protein